ncbi:hypothetical protein SLEP1_g59583, partial [Rubroshorea leprosula]
MPSNSHPHSSRRTGEKSRADSGFSGLRGKILSPKSCDLTRKEEKFIKICHSEVQTRTREGLRVWCNYIGAVCGNRTESFPVALSSWFTLDQSEL